MTITHTPDPKDPTRGNIEVVIDTAVDGGTTHTVNLGTFTLDISANGIIETFVQTSSCTTGEVGDLAFNSCPPVNPAPQSAPWIRVGN
jgi:hypothetical protein